MYKQTNGVVVVSDSGNNQFEDNFVVQQQHQQQSNNKTSQIKTHSFKPPSPMFKTKSELTATNNAVMSSYVAEVLGESAGSRMRRTSTPPFSSVFAEIECDAGASRLHAASSQLSVGAHSPRSANSSPKIQPKKPKDEKTKSTSSFIKKLSFKFKSSSNAPPSERTKLSHEAKSKQQQQNYKSTDLVSRSFQARQTAATVSASTQTIDTSYSFATSNLKQTSQASQHESTAAAATAPNTGSQLNLDTMRKVFNVFDSDHDGSITIQDVEKVMDSLQHLKNEIEMPSVDQIRIAFDKFDANKNGSIEFDEFLEILKVAGAHNADASNPSNTCNCAKNAQESAVDSCSPAESSQMTERVKTNMRIMFEQFDKDNDGKITRPELNFVMRNLFPDEVITDQDISVMLHAADLDRNGFIDFDEFANMFMLYSTNNPSTLNNSAVLNANGTLHPKLNGAASLNKSELNKSNRSLAKTTSRSNSKEDKRNRHPSGQRSEHHSPSNSNSGNTNNYKKVVQLFTTSQMMDLKAAFLMFDKNGDHKISEKELYEVMKYLGVNASEADVKAMIQVVDKNRNGYVDYDEFIQMMTQTHLKPLSEEEELRKTFNIFDIDGNGFISHDEIKTTMAHLGENLTDAEVKDMIRAADKNGDGKIDIKEFSGLLNGTNPFKPN